MAKFNAEQTLVSDDGATEHLFSLHGVHVRISPQDDGHAIEVQGVDADLAPESVHPAIRIGTSSEFRLGRYVMNLELAKPDASDIKPPAQIWIALTQEDLARAQSSDKLKMAYWNGGQWVVFSDTKHHFHTVEPETEGGYGYAVAELSRWGDPPLAIGH